MSHLPLSVTNRLNQTGQVCCFPILDAVFPNDLISDYLEIGLHSGILGKGPSLRLGKMIDKMKSLGKIIDKNSKIGNNKNDEKLMFCSFQ